MTWWALLLTFGSSLSWATFDAMRKVLAKSLSVDVLLVVLFLGQMPVLLVWWLMSGSTDIGAGYWLPALVSLVLHLVANLLFIRAVKISPLSSTIPFLSLSPVFVVLASVPLLAEWPNVPQGVGIAIIVLGAFLVNAGPGKLRLGALWKAYTSELGSVLMTIVACCWAVASSLDKMACRYADTSLHAFLQIGSMALVLTVVLAARGRLKALGEARSQLKMLVPAVVVGAAAMSLQLVAFQVMVVSLFEAIKRAVGMSAALAIGRVYFEEPIYRAKIIAAVMMTVGVALILGTG